MGGNKIFLIISIKSNWSSQEIITKICRTFFRGCTYEYTITRKESWSQKHWKIKFLSYRKMTMEFQKDKHCDWTKSIWTRYVMWIWRGTWEVQAIIRSPHAKTSFYKHVISVTITTYHSSSNVISKKMSFSLIVEYAFI